MLIERLPRARTREGSAKRDLAGRATYRRSPGPFQGLRGGTMSDEKIPRVLPRDVPDYHSRQAAHLRALAENATTARLKTRLLKEAERHEAAEEPEEALASS